MLFMNEMEIEDAVRRYRDHELLGPATRTLQNLCDAVNRNSDGWPYWSKPVRAAEKLQQLIQGEDRRTAYFDEVREDVTADGLKKAYAPIKRFRTSSGIQFEIVQPGVTA